MPEPTLLGDIIQPAWNSLTPEQRTCWHFFAAANPVMDSQGRLRTLYGQQLHYRQNKDLAVTESVPLLDHPPPALAAPRRVAVLSLAWPLAARIEGTTTARRGFVYLQLDDPLPEDTAAIVTQGYYQRRTGTGRPPRIRHVTVILPLDSGVKVLNVPQGYYASTEGFNKFATIMGITAQKRPSKPLGTLKVVNVNTGETVRQILSNPYGGQNKKTNRPRATAVNPDAGVNHYP